MRTNDELRQRLGRRSAIDARDAGHPMRELLGAAAPIPPYHAWLAGAVLDQGQSPECVAYAWEGWLNASPTRTTNGDPPETIYAKAQGVDEWAGTPHDGTTVRAGAKVMLGEGRIGRYVWADGIATAREWLARMGTVVLGTNWYECLVAGQRVLTADLRWLPVEALDIGDEIIGFSGLGADSVYQPATVLSRHKIVRPVYRVATTLGEIAASENHLVIRSHPKEGRSWVRIKDIRPGDHIAYTIAPFTRDTSWESGWLAGFFDGEGSVACGMVSVAQKEGATLDYAIRVAHAGGHDLRIKHVREDRVVHMDIVGDHAAGMRFLGSVRPQRLLPKAAHLWSGRRTYSKRTPLAIVEHVTAVGRDEVYAIGTSTGTLLTEGFLSHNSMFTPDTTGLVKVEGAIAGGHAFICLGYDDRRSAFLFQNSWGRSWGHHGRFWIADADVARLLSEQGEACAAVEVVPGGIGADAGPSGTSATAGPAGAILGGARG